MTVNETITELQQLVANEPKLGDLNFSVMDGYAGEILVINDLEVDRENSALIVMTE
jgi:hypothetical protein